MLSVLESNLFKTARDSLEKHLREMLPESEQIPDGPHVATAVTGGKPRLVVYLQRLAKAALPETWDGFPIERRATHNRFTWKKRIRREMRSIANK